MIDVATLNVIRRWALRDQLSIREISRRTGLARNTVKKYLRSDQLEPQYAKRASSSKLDPYADKLAGWLAAEVSKSRKQRLTLRQIHTVIFWKPGTIATVSRIVQRKPNPRRREQEAFLQAEPLTLK